MGCSVVSRCCACICAVALTAVVVVFAANTTVLAAEGISFDRDIRPLLSENCYACHGPGEQEAGLRLDMAERATAELDSGARAVVAGNLQASELIARIESTGPTW